MKESISATRTDEILFVNECESVGASVSSLVVAQKTTCIQVSGVLYNCKWMSNIISGVCDLLAELKTH